MHVILHDISKRYGDKYVLNELNLELNSGKCYAIVGASGIGKTTLLRLVADLEYPDSGSVNKPEDAIVSYAFQEPRLFPGLTVLENIQAIDPDCDAKEILRSLDLQSEANSYPSSLSGGMKKRAGLARALAKRANIYLIDEPTAGQDAHHSVEVAEAIRRYTEGALCLISTHDPDLISAVADEMIVFTQEGVHTHSVAGISSEGIRELMR